MDDKSDNQIEAERCSKMFFEGVKSTRIPFQLCDAIFKAGFSSGVRWGLHKKPNPELDARYNQDGSLRGGQGS